MSQESLNQHKARFPEEYRSGFIEFVDPRVVHLLKDPDEHFVQEVKRRLVSYAQDQARRFGYRAFALFPFCGSRKVPLLVGTVD